MSKVVKTYWLMKLLAADDPLFFITSMFNSFDIDTKDAYCVITLYLRLIKKHILKHTDKKFFKTFENRVIDAEELVGHPARVSQQYYNNFLFEWEKDLNNVFPVRHY